MTRLFGKSKTTKSTPSLQDASTSITARTKVIDNKIADLDNELRGYKEKMKQTKKPVVKQQLQKRAMEVLKMKRLYEQQREQIAGHQFSIDQTSFNVESARATVTTVSAMRAAHKDMKQAIRHDMNVNDIDDLANEMADMMDDMHEINEALGCNNFGTPQYIDESELDAELQMLDDELEDDAVHVTSTPSYLLPAQPYSRPGNKYPNQRIPAMPISSR